MCNKVLVKIPPLLNHVATIPCDLLLITVHVSSCCCFSDINISRGSLATHLRSGEKFYYRFITNLLLSLSVKEFRKSVSIIIGKVIVKNIVALFSGLGVYLKQCKIETCVWLLQTNNRK